MLTAKNSSAGKFGMFMMIVGLTEMIVDQVIMDFSEKRTLINGKKGLRLAVAKKNTFHHQKTAQEEVK